MLGDLRNKPHPIPRIAMYTQISSGTCKRVTDITFIPITYKRIRAVIGVHRIPMYAEDHILGGSNSMRRGIGIDIHRTSGR
jgi:hypothetical protein